MRNVEELKAKVLEAQQNSDIASLYVLEQIAHETFDEDALQGFYANILDLALEKLTDTLESHRLMDINEVHEPVRLQRSSVQSRTRIKREEWRSLGLHSDP